MAKLLEINAQDLKKMRKQLNEVQPNLHKEFVQQIKKVGREAQKPIKSGLRRIDPLSGMKDHYGATSWTNGRKAPDSTTVRSRIKAGGKSLTTSLLSIRINSAAASITDMAGRSGRSVGKGKRNSGYTPVIRRTADGGLVAYARETTVEAGRKFIANLNGVVGIAKRGASRIAWPSIEKDLPRFENEVDKVVLDYYRKANRIFS